VFFPKSCPHTTAIQKVQYDIHCANISFFKSFPAFAFKTGPNLKMEDKMIKSVHHTSLSVSDLERSKSFYVGLLGMEFVREGELSGPVMEKIVGLDKAHMKFAFVKMGPAVLEIFQYITPQGKNIPQPQCNIGIIHLAFEVEGIENVYEDLRSKGVKFVSPPQMVRTAKAAYFFDPDGITIEIFEPISQKPS
jgi:glyoxylase I family protein